jgi:cobalt-zinc-cadmium efflux system protein
LHQHTHDHPASTSGRAFQWAIALNASFVTLEVLFGLRAHSLALLSDAGHNLSDVLCVGLSWGAALLSQRQPSARRTYGLRRSSILAALANAVGLLVAVGAIVLAAVQRFMHPQAIHGMVVMAVAGAGIAVNGVSARLFASGRREDLNIRSAFAHFAADTAISAGVVLVGGVILLTGWLWLDPLVSLAVSVAIVLGTWGLLRDSLNLAMDAVPSGIDPREVMAYLEGVAGVVEVHDLHIWAMSTTETALTVHLVTRQPLLDGVPTREVCRVLHDRFTIGHATIQWERADAEGECRQAPSEVV